MQRLILASIVVLSYVVTASADGVLRVATYNVSMYRDAAGQLYDELKTGNSQQAKQIAEVIQRVRPDVLLLNEFDYEAKANRLPKVFRELYLGKSQAGLDSIEYGSFFYEPVNTGVDSKMDLDNDGKLGGPADAWGFGRYPGQYGMLLLSNLPISRGGTYRNTLWRELPDANWPKQPGSFKHYYPERVRQTMRLSSKSFWDVFVRLNKSSQARSDLHLLCAHPTPPGFDGPEDRNGWRNYDEIQMISHYISEQGKKPYWEDQNESDWGLPDQAKFIVLGDLNADPVDGSGRPGAIQQLLDHPAIDSSYIPTSEGAVVAAEKSQSNRKQKGDPAHHTANFGGEGYSNLRVDYALPSKGLKIVGGGVFWPKPGEPGAEAIKATDHRLVWIDIQLEDSKSADEPNKRD